MFKSFIEYVKGAYSELVNHVVWPSRTEVYKLTIVVAVFSAIFSVFVGIVDHIFITTLNKYYKIIKG